MKIYKEPAILTAAGIIAAAVIGFVVTTPPTNTNATVDNIVPLPLQIGDKPIEKSTSTSSTASQSTSQSSQSSVKLPDIGNINSKSSSSTLTQNPLGGQ